MILRVTQQHIDDAKRDSNYNFLWDTLCPLAQAMSELGEDAEATYICLSYVKHGLLMVARPSRAVTKFMEKFDAKLEVKPTNFRVTFVSKGA